MQSSPVTSSSSLMLAKNSPWPPTWVTLAFSATLCAGEFSSYQGTYAPVPSHRNSRWQVINMPPPAKHLLQAAKGGASTEHRHHRLSQHATVLPGLHRTWDPQSRSDTACLPAPPFHAAPLSPPPLSTLRRLVVFRVNPLSDCAKVSEKGKGQGESWAADLLLKFVSGHHLPPLRQPYRKPWPVEHASFA